MVRMLLYSKRLYAKYEVYFAFGRLYNRQ